MTILLAGAAVLVTTASGLPGVLLRRSATLGQRLSCAMLCAGAVLGLVAAVTVLGGAPAAVLDVAWAEPGAALALRLDALSALFLVPVLAVPAICSVYGLGYWPQAQLGAKAIRLQLAFGLTTGAMALVVLAANGILFLAGWEIMAVGGFLLVWTEHERADVQRAAFLYLVAAHVGLFALYAFFSIAAHEAGSFDFARWRGLAAAGPLGGWCFALLLAGFGMKAGFLPLHFWLPPAHAAAPSHVSAIMSGVLLKTGIYGLLRFTGLFDAPPASWGAVLLAIATASGVLGVAFALGQHDLKRLLAWHSVENIGIIGMGAGLALLGRARGDPALIVLGFSGAALHVVNHATFKSLLFLGAGCVQHACGTRELDRLGGLARAMPFTAALFLLGAAAISGLPPLNGFASEWFVGLAALETLVRSDLVGFAVLALPALALIGGLASACFVKVHGTVFLGSGRSPEAARAHEPPAVMLAPMGVLAAACVAIGVFPWVWVSPLVRAASAWSGLGEAELAAAARPAAAGAGMISACAAALLAAVLAGALLRRRVGAGTSARAETWGCGFAAPTARMQYTASSFAQLLVDRFSWALRTRNAVRSPRGAFPRGASFESHVPDAVLDGVLLPATRGTERLSALLRPLLRVPRIHLHVAFLVATLLVVLAWRFLG